jgi:hypothetical protein
VVKTRAIPQGHAAPEVLLLLCVLIQVNHDMEESRATVSAAASDLTTASGGAGVRPFSHSRALRLLGKTESC